MKKFYLFVTLVITIAFVLPAFAGVGTNLSGPHFNLNIIGVPHDKEVPSMTNSSGHRIFVPLQSGEDVARQVKIKYVIGDRFKVLDANATDDNEAVIQVPYEYCQDYNAGCYDMLSFNVYAFALGKPGGAAIVTAECDYTKDVVDPDGSLGLECEDTLLMGSFEIKRTKGTPKEVNITNIFRVTGCLDNDADGVCDSGDLEFRNLWIFNIEELASYMWDYDNNGLKVMQVRFYETSSGYIGYVP